MRIIDCSSDVCSSDLLDGPFVRHHEPVHQPDERGLPGTVRPDETGDPAGGNGGADRVERRRIPAEPLGDAVETNQDAAAHVPPPPGRASGRRTVTRSEEHTSELQSLMRISYAVLRLRKKKQPQKLMT